MPSRKVESRTAMRAFGDGYWTRMAIGPSARGIAGQVGVPIAALGTGPDAVLPAQPDSSARTRSTPDGRTTKPDRSGARSMVKDSVRLWPSDLTASGASS